MSCVLLEGVLWFSFTWTETSLWSKPKPSGSVTNADKQGDPIEKHGLFEPDEKGMQAPRHSSKKENPGFTLSRLGHSYQVFDTIWIQDTKMKKQAVLMVSWRGSLISLMTGTVKPGHYKPNTGTKLSSPLLNYYDYNCQTNYSNFHQLRNCHSPFPLSKSRTPKSRWNSKAFAGISYLEMIQHEVLIFFLIHLLDACACGRLQDRDNLVSETRKKSEERFPWQVS